MQIRSALTILLVMLSLVTPSGTDQFDQLKFRLRDGYQVIAQGAIGPLDGLNLLIDTGSYRSMVDDRIAKQLHLEIHQAETMVFDRRIRILSGILWNLRVGSILADTASATVGFGRGLVGDHQPNRCEASALEWLGGSNRHCVAA
jgi:hypothetical protein